MVLLAIVAALLVVARLTPVWVLPVIVVGGLFGVSVVGAFQLRQDNRLSEQGFLRLMIAALGKLPLAIRGGRTRGELSVTDEPREDA
jgi:hypothetical protein